MVRYYKLITLFLFIGIAVFSQDKYQKFYHLTQNAGLSQSTVNCIIKDSTGYMWFGTNDGLNRYDGYTCTVFKHNPKNSSSIGLGRIITLFLDSQGQLWVGTDQGGLSLYNPEHENFIRLQYDANNTFGLTGNMVRTIFETKSKKIWIGTDGGGLNLYDPQLKKIIAKQILPGKPTINCITADSTGQLWIATTSGVFVIPKGSDNAPYEFNDIEITAFHGKNVYALYIDNNEHLWLGTDGHGAYSLNLKNNNVVQFNLQNNMGSGLNHNIIRTIIGWGDKNILFGSGGGGINNYDTESGKFKYIRTALNNQYSINSDIIYSFFIDDQKNLWIGTYNGGVNILFSNKDKFTHIKSFGETTSISNNAVLSMVEDKAGKIWMGTDGGGINVFDPQTGEFLNSLVNNQSINTINQKVIKSLLFDHEGKLWIGTFNEGLAVFDPTTRTIKKFTFNPNNSKGISQNNIWDLTEDHEGNIWMAILGGGVDCYIRKTGNFKHYRYKPERKSGLNDNHVSCIMIDTRGDLWIGTEYGGLNHLVDIDESVFKHYIINNSDSKSLNNNQIITLFEDSRQQIWVGTSGGGLNLYNRKQENFTQFTQEDGLSSNVINAILEDNQKNLWISTNNGITKFINGVVDQKNPKFINFDVSDGLQGNEFSPQTSLLSMHGELYFGGLNGFNFINPEKTLKNKHIPNVVITDLKIFNKSVIPNRSGSPLKQSISLTQQIILSPKQSVLTLEFSALDFTMPAKNHYKYILEGFEEEWNVVGNQRTATYTNLNPGTYIFRVLGSNNDAVWNTEGKTLKIIIQPPFYKTWIFRILFIILVLLIIYIIYKTNVRSLENQRQQLKLLVDDRTRDLLNLNEVLEGQNSEIQQQKVELLEQKESLVNINLELNQNQHHIGLQNQELEKHRNNLEELVAQRTSELEKAKIKAEESDKLKMAFLSNMSHEIRTPMNAIIGFSSLLSDNELSADEREVFIRQINTNGESLLVLIDDILELSRIEANQIEVKLSAFDLLEFLDDLFLNYKKIERSKIQLIRNFDIQPENYITTDKHRLRQILVNLLDNAFKFTEEGQIEIKALIINKFIQISVRDSGIGIQPENLKVIFDRFRKGNEMGEKLYRGAGLGLTISRRLAELLGGNLWAESILGSGSTFFIKIPEVHKEQIVLQKNELTEIPAIKELEFNLKGKLILIVEDEVHNYEFLSRLLVKKEANIVWAKDGLEALNSMKVHEFDLVLMDIKMPVMNGYDALSAIKKLTPKIPVIAQTAFARLDEEAKIRHAGFDDYISKPIKPTLLYKILARYV